MDYSIGDSLTADDRTQLSAVRSDLLKTDASPAMACAIAAALLVDAGDLALARSEICQLLGELRPRDIVREEHGDAVHAIFSKLGGHTLQNTIVRGLLDIAVRIAGCVPPVRIGERAGGIHAYVTQLARHRASEPVPANDIPLPLAA